MLVRFRFRCPESSGGVIGAAGAFLAMLETLQTYGTCFVDDQRCFARYFLEHPGAVALDHGASIFLNLFGVQDILHRYPGGAAGGASDGGGGGGEPMEGADAARSSFVFKGAAAGGQLVGGPTGSAPCMVHGNGASKALIQTVVRAWRVARGEKRDVRMRVNEARQWVLEYAAPTPALAPTPGSRPIY